MRVVRDIETLDEGLFGGHSEVVFDGCVVGPESVLGEVDRGFEYAQVRLAPARLTHCMRWLGLARRAHGIAVDWAATRRSFGGLLGDLGMVQQLVADSEIDMAASRALIWHTAAVARQRGPRRDRILHRQDVRGRGGQPGGRPFGADLRCARRLRRRPALPLPARGAPFRIYDGPSEVHRWAIGRRAISQRRRAIEGGEPPRWQRAKGTPS